MVALLQVMGQSVSSPRVGFGLFAVTKADPKGSALVYGGCAI